MRRIYLTTTDGRPKPQQCFLSGRLRWTLLPKESYSESLSDHGSTTQLPSNWEADTLWLPIKFSTCKKQELNLHSKSVCLRHTNTQAFRCESDKKYFFKLPATERTDQTWHNPFEKCSCYSPVNVFFAEGAFC